MQRAAWVRVNEPDLFVILIRAMPSLLGADPLRLLRDGGLNLTPHRIELGQAGPGRLVTQDAGQRAPKLSESLNIAGTILGEAEHTTPIPPILAQRMVTGPDAV